MFVFKWTSGVSPCWPFKRMQYLLSAHNTKGATAQGTICSSPAALLQTFNRLRTIQALVALVTLYCIKYAVTFQPTASFYGISYNHLPWSWESLHLDPPTSRYQRLLWLSSLQVTESRRLFCSLIASSVLVASCVDVFFRSIHISYYMSTFYYLFVFIDSFGSFSEIDSPSTAFILNDLLQNSHFSNHWSNAVFE